MTIDEFVDLIPRNVRWRLVGDGGALRARRWRWRRWRLRRYQQCPIEAVCTAEHGLLQGWEEAGKTLGLSIPDRQRIEDAADGCEGRWMVPSRKTVLDLRERLLRATGLRP